MSGSNGGPVPALHRRLTLIFLSVLLALQGALGWLVLDSRREDLLHTLDAGLLARSRALVPHLELAGPTDGESRLATLEDALGDLAYVALHDDGGLPLGATVPDAVLPLPYGPPDEPAFHDLDAAASSLAGLGDQPLRVLAYPVVAGGGERRVLVVARDASSVAGTLGEVTRALWWTMLVSLLGAGLVVWFLIGRALAPLSEIARAARRSARGCPPGRGPGRSRPSRPAEARVVLRDLDEAFARMETSTAAERHFAAVAAHELKSPVATLLTEAQVLRRSERVEPEALKDFVASVEGEAARLGHLVESLLALARAEQARGIELEPVDLNDVLLEAVRRVTPYARQRDQRVDLQLVEPGEDQVAGAPLLLEALFVNLLRNALRFSPTGSAVELRALRRHGRLRVLVKDSGPGLEPALGERAFDPFVQAPGEESRGSGLGLALVRRVAALHGAEVEVGARPGGGSVFVVELLVGEREAVVSGVTG